MYDLSLVNQNFLDNWVVSETGELRRNRYGLSCCCSLNKPEPVDNEAPLTRRTEQKKKHGDSAVGFRPCSCATLH